MKLYECPINSMVRFIDNITLPIGGDAPDDIVQFKHVDGMYSYCINSDGTVVHPAAWTEVQIVGKVETNGL